MHSANLLHFVASGEDEMGGGGMKLAYGQRKFIRRAARGPRRKPMVASQ